MSVDVDQPRKRRGPPRRTGIGHTIGVRLRPKTLAALDRAVAEQTQPATRAGLAKRIVQGWLREHGLL